MIIKNDAELALGISTTLSSKAADTTDTAITYAEETNLTVSDISQTASQQALSATAAYKALLEKDAKNIGSLGTDFQSLDRKISQLVQQHF